MINTAFILAGGKGERMLPITELQPKALVPINGVPIIKLQVEQLIRNNVTKIIILTGYLGEQIRQYVDSLNYGPIVSCIESNPELTPSERLIEGLKSVSDNYILLYCDNFIPNDNIIKQQLNTKNGVSIVIQKRDEGNIYINQNLSAVYDGRNRKSSNPYVELGYLAVSSNEFNKQIKYYKDINTALEDFSKKNILKFTELIEDYCSLSNFTRYINQNLHGKIIIIDRDGIINTKMGRRKYLTSLEMLSYEDENLEVLSKLGKDGYSFIVATNQPGISTGELSESFLDQLHKKITNDLRIKSINILTFYVCRHHWNDLCGCRKPNPGMLLSAICDFKLDKAKTVYIGDEEKDVLAANSAKLIPVLISKEIKNLNNLFPSMGAALKFIQDNYNKK
jgi:D-glycero-D-manno-heptose 1,7-bisphosphate phosphatase